MAVTIRLTRAGSKKVPFYRVVAADSRSPRDGRFIEQLGVYDPLRSPPEVRIDPDRLMSLIAEQPAAAFSPNGILRLPVDEPLLEKARGVLLSVRSTD